MSTGNLASLIEKHHAPYLPDYRSDFSANSKRQSSGSGDSAMSWLKITGTVELMATIGRHTIGAASLLVMYWPDKKLPDAYIEVCVKGVNE